MRTALFCALALVASSLNSVAAETEPSCPTPRVIAPGKFNNIPKQWGTSDTGIIASGFVELSQETGKVFEVEHGIDLSRWNTIEYARAAHCGASFAFVQLDEMYVPHSRKLVSAGIRTLPYAYFAIPSDLRTAATYANAPELSAKLDSLLAKFASIGREAAREQLSQITKLGGLQEVSFANITAKVLAIDIEQKLLDEKKSTRDQRVAYGRVYARALCSWLDTVRSQQPSIVAVLYTTPSLYGDYLRYALQDDNACLNGLPVWVAHTTSDAGDSVYSSIRGASSANLDQAAQRLCLVSGGNRCVIHQYSHRATFVAIGPAKGGVPPHTDIDRWFFTRIVPTAAGPQFVRRDSLNQPVNIALTLPKAHVVAR